MKAFAEALSLERDFFEKYIKHPISALRALHYPMVGDGFLNGQQRAGAHTDYGSLTILLPEEGSTGLQVIHALSFYRPQNVLGWSKFFVLDQELIYIFWQSQKFCARQKDDLHSVKLVFVPAQKFLKRH